MSERVDRSLFKEEMRQSYELDIHLILAGVRLVSMTVAKMAEFADRFEEIDMSDEKLDSMSADELEDYFDKANKMHTILWRKWFDSLKAMLSCMCHIDRSTYSLDDFKDEVVDDG